MEVVKIGTRLWELRHGNFSVTVNARGKEVIVFPKHNELTVATLTPKEACHLGVLLEKASGLASIVQQGIDRMKEKQDAKKEKRKSDGAVVQRGSG
jgi:hypothetical protein